MSERTTPETIAAPDHRSGVHDGGRRRPRAWAVGAGGLGLALVLSGCGLLGGGSGPSSAGPATVTVTQAPSSEASGGGGASSSSPQEPSSSPASSEPASSAAPSSDSSSSASSAPSSSPSSGSASSAPSSDAPGTAGLSSPKPPASESTVTPEGEFALGETVALDITQVSSSMKGMYGMSVLGIQEGAAKDLEALDVPASELAGKTPYYVTYELSNLSGTDMNFANPKAFLQLVYDDGGTALGATELEDEKFEKCPAGGTNDRFASKGDTFRDCVIFLAGEGAVVEGVGFADGYQFQKGSGWLWKR